MRVHCLHGDPRRKSAASGLGRGPARRGHGRHNSRGVKDVAPGQHGDAKAVHDPNRYAHAHSDPYTHGDRNANGDAHCDAHSNIYALSHHRPRDISERRPD